MTKPAAPTQPDPNAPPEGEPTPPAEPTELDPRDQEIADLKAQNEDLRTKQTPAPTPPPTGNEPPKITSTWLRTLTPQQQEDLEKQSGYEFKDILAATERKEIQETNTSLLSKVNVNDALETAQAADPEVVKMKGHMRAYLAKLPAGERADTERLAKHMADAKTFARGKLAESAGPNPGPGKPGHKQPSPPPPGEEPPADEEDPNAVKPGAEVKIGSLNLKVSDLVPAEMAKRIKHPEDPNGVSFKDFDKEPEFG